MSCSALSICPGRSLIARREASNRSAASRGHWTDVLTVEVLTLRGLVTYYVLFFIHLESRRVNIAEEPILHSSVVIAGPTLGGSPDVVLSPDVDPFIADH